MEVLEVINSDPIRKWYGMHGMI